VALGERANGTFMAILNETPRSRESLIIVVSPDNRGLYFTLGPLAQPNKALGLESRIGPWLAKPQPTCFHKSRKRVDALLRRRCSFAHNRAETKPMQ